MLLGSHSDTQPRGGWLDGAMGVIYALEAVRALTEDPTTAHLAIDIASWMDEEGTYLGMVGCKSFCGLLDEDAVNKRHQDRCRRKNTAYVKRIVNLNTSRQTKDKIYSHTGRLKKPIRAEKKIISGRKSG